MEKYHQFVLDHVNEDVGKPIFLEKQFTQLLRKYFGRVSDSDRLILEKLLTSNKKLSIKTIEEDGVIQTVSTIFPSANDLICCACVSFPKINIALHL